MMPARLNIGMAELETFLVIAELGSFSRAAERLSLAQPSVSNRIQRLERAFQTRLFDRTTRAVILTPAGKRLRDRVEPIIGNLQAVIAEFRTEADTRRQSVVVATTPMLATLVMPPIIGRFEQGYPSVSVELNDQTADLGAQIRSGQIDMAFVARPPPTEGVEFEPIVTNPFRVVGPRGHDALATGTVTPDELARHPFLVLSAYMFCVDKLVRHLEGRGPALRPVRTVNNVSTLLGLVAAGLGLTLLPQLVVNAGGAVDDSRFDSAALSGLVVTREYGIISLVGHDWAPGARAFATALREGVLALSVPASAPGRVNPARSAGG